MEYGQLNDRQWQTSLRDVRRVLWRQASDESDIIPLLEHEVARRLEGEVPREVLENIARGIDELLGRRGEHTAASRWLTACLRALADEWAGEYAERVAYTIRTEILDDEQKAADTQGGE